MDLTRLISKLDLNHLAAEFMGQLKIQPFDLYFVVFQPDGEDDYEILGMTYSLSAAREMVQDGKCFHQSETVKVLQLDLAKLLKIIEQLHGAHEVNV